MPNYCHSLTMQSRIFYSSLNCIMRLDWMDGAKHENGMSLLVGSLSGSSSNPSPGCWATTCCCCCCSTARPNNQVGRLQMTRRHQCCDNARAWSSGVCFRRTFGKTLIYCLLFICIGLRSLNCKRPSFLVRFYSFAPSSNSKPTDQTTASYR